MNPILTPEIRSYFPILTTRVSVFFDSIFVAFFKVFLAMLFSLNLICPDGHVPITLQRSAQTQRARFPSLTHPFSSHPKRASSQTCTNGQSCVEISHHALTFSTLAAGKIVH